MKLMRLKLLRLIIILAVTIFKMATKDDGHSAGAEWMLHYLLGTGTTKALGDVSEDFQDFEYSRDLLYNTEIFGMYSTVNYNGRGFYNRPAAFYTIGCFTGYASEVSQEDDYIVYNIEDIYDWHASGSQYFTTPLPLWIVISLGWVFGREYFPTCGFPMGNPGVSNKLWGDLELVGARPFKTEATVCFSYEYMHDTATYMHAHEEEEYHFLADLAEDEVLQDLYGE